MRASGWRETVGFRPLGQLAAEIMPVAAHGEGGRADRAPEIEGEDLRPRIAAELQRHEREQHGFAGPGRPDDQRMADIAHMEREPERRRALGLAVEQRRAVEMGVPLLPGPDGGERDHMGEVQGGDRRLADIGVGLPRQRAEPGIDGIDRLDHGGEVPALHDLLDEAQFLVGAARVLVPDDEGRRDIGLARDIGAELLQGHVGIGGLVGGVRVDQRRLLVGHHLLQDRGDGFALGEPLAADAGNHPRGLRLVHQDRAGRPAIGKGQPVEVIEDAGRGGGRETREGQDAQMGVPQPGLQPAGQRLIGQQRVEIGRGFRHADAVGLRRDRGMQIGQRLAVIDPAAFGHDAVEERQHPVGAVDEAAQHLARIDAGLVAAFVEPGLGPRGLLGGRQVEEGQDILRLEMRSLLGEPRAAFGIEERRGRIGKAAVRIVGRCHALRLDEDRPAGAEATEGVVDAPRHGHEFGRDRAVEIGAAEPGRALQAAILVQHDAGGHQRRPGQVIRQPRSFPAIFREVHHGAASDLEMTGKPQMSASDLDEERIAPRGPDRHHMAQEADDDPGDPELQPEPDGPGQRAVQDREGPRRAGQQDRLGQRPVDRDGEARHVRQLLEGWPFATAHGVPPSRLSTGKPRSLCGEPVVTIRSAPRRRS